MLSTSAAVGTTVWIAPSVLSVDRIAAATGSCAAEVPVMSDGAELVAPPADIASLTSNTTSFVWLETESEVLDSSLVVNRSTEGSFFPTSNQATVIPANTSISSYLVHGRRLQNSGSLTGRITFPTAQILGVIYLRDELTASNFLASPETNAVAEPLTDFDSVYLNLSNRGHALYWKMYFGNTNDNIRIIVSC